MMSAHLSRPIISTASAVRAAETATWAEAVCNSVCVYGDGNKAVGCMRTGLQCAKIPIGNMYIYMQSESKAQKGCCSNTHTQNETTTTIS